ncbi:hypothetical protein [Micromonospora humi]|uniref:Uncharacterized protein n=1 Tax=Micromonospora humi TaxID=745366 RepID=A0A1C5HLN4_9ACTN|nr:hypothetical protein [Micromonospora humi]SCG46878.1 hypothetical protein GA0070213_103289 [Micromonospora humi]
MRRGRGQYVPTPREQEELTRRYIAEQQQAMERLVPTATRSLERELEANERAMRQVLGSSDDGREWAREVAAKEPRASHGPQDVRPAWVTKAAARSRPLDQDVYSDEEW